MHHLAFSLIFVVALLFSPSLFSQQETDPCRSEQHAQFDFWVGQWAVTVSNKAAGNNTIKKIEGGCVLRESWQSATSPYTGTSYSFYNQAKKQWEQLWLDNRGGFLKLAGNRIGNKMILQSAETENAEGDKVTQKISWTLNENGSVRQLWEVLTVGKDTQIAFDGLYQKAEQKTK